MFVELWDFPNLQIPPDTYFNAHLNQSVPGGAPVGEYLYKCFCGDKENWEVCDRDSFFFTVVEDGFFQYDNEWILKGGWDDTTVLPAEYILHTNYPNPFNATTQISFGIAQAENVRLDVYNLTGQRVEMLVNELKSAGSHSVTWDASQYSSGIYFYKLTTGDIVFTKRMTLLK